MLVWLTAASCLLAVSCESTDSKGKKDNRKRYGTLAPSGIQDSVSTPAHSLSRRDYPFDSAGNYRKDWVTGSSSSSSRPRTAAVSPKPTSSPTKPAPSRTGSSSGRRYHIVKSGDTLFSISRTYGVSLNDLRKLNSLATYKVRSGSVLRIPAG